MDYAPKYTFSAGTVTSALEVAENMFEPHTSPTSPAVFNGWLDETNRETAWDVEWEMVRKGTFSRPAHSNGSSGATANTDFFSDLYQGDDWDLNDVTEASNRAVAMPGCSRTYEVPWATATAVYLHFTVTLIGHREGYAHPDSSNPPPTSSPVGNTLLVPFLNGKPLKWWTRRVISSRLTLTDRPTPNSLYIQDYVQPEQRTYAFSCMINPRVAVQAGLISTDNNPLLRGNHRVSLRIVHREDHFRVKTCHVTAIPIR